MFSSLPSSPLVHLGHLLFGILILLATQSSSAAPLKGDHDGDLCTSRGIETFLSEIDSVEDIKLAYEFCTSDFLNESPIGPAVKQTIDNWIGTDLSEAETNQIFLIYELVLASPRPNNLTAEFNWQCKQMVDRFQAYRDLIEPLAARIDGIDLDSLLTEGDEEIDEEQRDLLNYVQYAQFCKSLLDETQDRQGETN